MRLRLGVTFHTVFYTPFFVAKERGLFAAEGLDLSAEMLGDGRRVLAGLERGELDAGIGGVMRSMLSYDQGVAEPPVHFAQINDRDGFFILGRPGPFDWPDLLGRRLILFSEAPTPWYVLRAFLLERGLDPDRIEVVADLPAPAAAAAFAAGQADFLEAPAHIAEGLLRDSGAVVLREMAAELGSIPYSSYSALPGYLDQEPEAVKALVRAHLAALRWMQSASGAEIWQTIRPSFPGVDDEVYRRAVERYHRLGTWPADASLPRATYARLADLLHRGGLISRVAPYELVCRDDVVRAVMAEGRA